MDDNNNSKKFILSSYLYRNFKWKVFYMLTHQRDETDSETSSPFFMSNFFF